MQSVIVTEQKQCDCKSTSTTNCLRFETLRIDKDSCTYRINFYPGMSCNECGKPWKVILTDEDIKTNDTKTKEDSR